MGGIPLGPVLAFPLLGSMLQTSAGEEVVNEGIRLLFVTVTGAEDADLRHRITWGRAGAMGTSWGCTGKESSILLCLGITDAPRAFKWVIPIVKHPFQMLKPIQGKNSFNGKSSSSCPQLLGKAPWDEGQPLILVLPSSAPA